MKNKILSPTLKIPIIYDKNGDSMNLLNTMNNYLKTNKVKDYASVNKKGDELAIAVTDNFRKLNKNEKLFAILHEEGHINANSFANDITSEIAADKYALEHLGKKRTYEAMNFFVHDSVGESVETASRYIARMSELGLINNRNSKNFIINTILGQMDVNASRKAFGLPPMESGIKKIAKSIAKFKVR